MPKGTTDRLPDYHRLDLALNWQLGKPEGRFQHELIFSVYNLYNRKNPVALHFNKIDDGQGIMWFPMIFITIPPWNLLNSISTGLCLQSLIILHSDA